MVHISEKKISAFCDGELAGEEKAVVAEHLRDCARCRKIYEEISGLAASLDFIKAVEVDPYFTARLKREVSSGTTVTRLPRVLVPVTAVGAAMTFFVGGYLGLEMYGNGYGEESGNTISSYLEVTPLQDYPEGSFGDVYDSLVYEEVNDEE